MGVTVQSKKFFLLGVMLCCLFAMALYQLANSRQWQLFGNIVNQVKTEEKVVALTLDDGPSMRYTEAILQLLDVYHVKATFFVVGQDSQRFMQQTKKIVQQGHELGNHSYTHPSMLFKSLSTIRQEIEQTDKVIRQAGYQGDIHFRAPYTQKLLLLPWYLNQTNRLNISWNLGPDSHSTRAVKKEAESIAQYVLDNVQPGSIILLHVMYENGEASRQALPLIIRGLQQQGYAFLTISELLKRDQR